MTKELLILIFILTTSQALASNTLYCTHPQICNSVEYLLGDKYSYKSAIKMTGNPHHHEVTTRQMKRLLSTKNLFFHSHLQPEIKKVVQKNPHAIDTAFRDRDGHFWTSPEKLEVYLKNLKSLLLKKGLKVINKKIIDTKEKFSRLDGETLVLSHNALAPLFLSLGAKLIILSSVGHHHGLGASTLALKNLEDRLKNPRPITWFFEKEIHQVSSLKKKIRPQDKLIELSITGTLGDSPFKLLDQLSKMVVK